jgi:hypothetical protein
MPNIFAKVGGEERVSISAVLFWLLICRMMGVPSAQEEASRILPSALVLFGLVPHHHKVPPCSPSMANPKHSQFFLLTSIPIHSFFPLLIPTAAASFDS